MDSEGIKSLIIDDDPFIHRLLKDKLEQYFPEIEVVAAASSGTEGLELIVNHQPDLVFLDVEMADMTGFEMLSQLQDIRFETIFITSYNHYAIKAIRFNALDYLLKPFDLGELKHAVNRFKAQGQPKESSGKMKQALNNLKTKSNADQVLTLQTQDGELQLYLKDIVQIQGERNYSLIHLTNGKQKLTTKTLGEMEEMLEDKGFFRCHKSHLVNHPHVQAIRSSTSVKLSDDNEVPVSRRKKDAFREWYSNYME